MDRKLTMERHSMTCGSITMLEPQKRHFTYLKFKSNIITVDPEKAKAFSKLHTDVLAETNLLRISSG